MNEKSIASVAGPAPSARRCRPAEPLAIGREVLDVLIDEIAECGLGRRLPANWMLAPVNPAFRLADPCVRIRLHDKGLAKDVTFTSYLRSPFATRPPVN